MSLSIPQELIEQLKKGNVVLFCGAGISVSEGGLPSGEQLARELAERAGEPELAEAPLPEVAQAYELKMGHQSLIEYIANRIDDPRYVPLRTHQLIADLPCTKIVTTNWDRLLEKAMDQAVKPVVKVVRDSDVAYADEAKVLLVKFHGSVEQKDSIIITGDDYYDVFARLRGTANLVRAYFSTKTILFLGFGLADDDFKRLYYEVVRRIGVHQRRAYAVQLGPDERTTKYWEKKNVQIIAADATMFLEALADALGMVAEATEPTPPTAPPIPPPPTLDDERLQRETQDVTAQPAETIPIAMVERKATLSNQGVDFVLVTALAEERDAVLDKLPGYRKLPPFKDDIRTYFQAELSVTFPDGETGTYRVIVMPLLGMGRVQAATATTDAITRWHPRYIVLVGIAGGVAARGVSIGDILIADQIVDYELQKLTPQGPQVRWEVHRANPRLLNACHNFMGENWQELARLKHPARSKPKRHTGPIASGDKVIAFGDVLERYREVWPKLIGVEMEAAGVATAAFQSSEAPGFFMVRCVSDLADEHKGSADVEKWRSYACDAAASFAIALLKSGPVHLLNGSAMSVEPPPVGRRPEQLPQDQTTGLGQLGVAPQPKGHQVIVVRFSNEILAQYRVYSLCCHKLLDSCEELSEVCDIDTLVGEFDAELRNSYCGDKYDLAVESVDHSLQKLINRYDSNTDAREKLIAIRWAILGGAHDWDFCPALIEFMDIGKGLAQDFYCGGGRAPNIELIDSEAPTLVFSNRCLSEDDPLCIFAEAWPSEHQPITILPDGIHLPFSEDFRFCYYLSYPVLFFHEYVSHVYVPGIESRKFSEGWLMYAIELFMKTRWTELCEKYPLTCAQINVLKKIWEPRFTRLASKGYHLAENVNMWIGNDKFLHFTWDLASYLPDIIAEHCDFHSDFLDQIKPYTSRGRGHLLRSAAEISTSALQLYENLKATSDKF